MLSRTVPVKLLLLYLAKGTETCF